MKLISETDLELTIKSLEEQIKLYENKKDETIDNNAPKIQELINKKVNELAEQIKQDAIMEICGQELNKFDTEIEKLTYSRQLLLNLISESKDEKEDEEITNNTEINNTETNEDINEGGNE